MKKIRIFHHDDADGYAAGYLAYKYEAERVENNSTIRTYDINYNKEFPLELINSEDKVYILDYSIHPSDMIKLLRITKNVIWIDHHISSIEKYDDWNDLIEKASGLESIKGIRVNGISGCALTYLYLFNHWNEDALIEFRDTISTENELVTTLTKDFEDSAPKYLQYINDWDIWCHKFPESEMLQIAIANNLSIDLILNLDLDTDESNLNKLLEKGKCYIEYRNQWSDQFMKRYAFETVLEYIDGSYKHILVANLGNANSKFFGNRISCYDAVVTQCFDGDRWNFSIYSEDEDFDCSLVARYFGGGGHKGAAGFTSKNPFTKSIVLMRE